MMEKVFKTIICVTYLISTFTIWKLFAYTIVRYRTSARGGIHTGLSVAGLVILILGMSLYCNLAAAEALIIVFSGDNKPSAIYLWMIKHSKGVIYLFTISWLNANLCFTTRKIASMQPPEYTHRVQDYGLCNPTLWKRISFAIVILIFYVAGIVVSPCLIDEQSSQMVQEEKRNSSLCASNTSLTRQYVSTAYYTISGVCYVINVAILISLIWYMKKSTVRREDGKQELWKKIPRALKSTIKCSILMTVFWLCDLSSWLINIMLTDRKSNLIITISQLLQIIYSCQGFVLYLIVFFYRSKQDENPVMKSISKLLIRDTKDNVGFNAAENRVNNVQN